MSTLQTYDCKKHGLASLSWLLFLLFFSQPFAQFHNAKQASSVIQLNQTDWQGETDSQGSDDNLEILDSKLWICQNLENLNVSVLKETALKSFYTSKWLISSANREVTGPPPQL